MILKGSRSKIEIVRRVQLAIYVVLTNAHFLPGLRAFNCVVTETKKNGYLHPNLSVFAHVTEICVRFNSRDGFNPTSCFAAKITMMNLCEYWISPQKAKSNITAANQCVKVLGKSAVMAMPDKNIRKQLVSRLKKYNSYYVGGFFKSLNKSISLWNDGTSLKGMKTVGSYAQDFSIHLVQLHISFVNVFVWLCLTKF